MSASDPEAPVTIDCRYLGERGVAAAYLLRSGDRAAFVDNNTAHAVPRLLAALAQAGLVPSQVEYLIVTHVHLDHAGGTAALAAACPDATVLCHPRAERHLVDPSRLTLSARAVYGDEQFEKLYGTLGPVAAGRVRAVADESEVAFGGRSLRFLHTRGHANHHMCILDGARREVFTGDAFGLCYPRLQSAGVFAFPSTSPTDFDAVEARRSVERIVKTGARTAYPTHFGAVTGIAEAAAQLDSFIDRSEGIVTAAASSSAPDPDLDAFCLERLNKLFYDVIARRGLALGGDDWDFLQLDRDLNAQGLAHVARMRRKAARGEA